MAANAASVPLLDYSLVANNRQIFVNELRNAVVNAGFFYLSNTPISIDDVNDLIASIPRLFDLPKKTKDKISIKNSPHFFGYSRFGSELTKGQADQREHFEFGTPHVCRWEPGDPDYLKTLGPSQVVCPSFGTASHAADPWRFFQWPEEALLPGFKELLLRYLTQVQDLSYRVVSLIAEALGLQADALDLFYDAEELVQHNARVRSSCFCDRSI
jgi:isopenicillin N synthase-like dioxygenase